MAQGRNRVFLTTRWSLVARAASSTAPGAREALEELCRSYWWPLYAYLRGKGLAGGDAADIVQGLFVELIDKGRLAHADRERGRFRTWLLSALRFHLSHEREREGSLKRGGGGHVVALDHAEADRRWSLVSDRELDPERLFERAWAIEVMKRALIELKRRYADQERARIFAALKPALVGDARAESLSSIATRLGMTEGAVKVAAHRLRLAFRDAIRAEVTSTLADQHDAEDEIRALFAALST